MIIIIIIGELELFIVSDRDARLETCNEKKRRGGEKIVKIFLFLIRVDIREWSHLRRKKKKNYEILHKMRLCNFVNNRNLI